MVWCCNLTWWHILTIQAAVVPGRSLGSSWATNKHKIPTSHSYLCTGAHDLGGAEITRDLDRDWDLCPGCIEKARRNYQTDTHIRPITGSYALSTQNVCSTGQGQVQGA